MKALNFILLFLHIALASLGYSQIPNNKDKVQFDQQEKESIYSFLVKNNLTSKSEQEFYSTYSNSAKAKELYAFFIENKLTEKDFETFYKDIIQDSNFLHAKWLITPSEKKMELIYNYLSAKNSKLIEKGYDKFANDMKVESNLEQVYDGLSKKYPEWKAIGYYAFKEEMYSKETHQVEVAKPAVQNIIRIKQMIRDLYDEENPKKGKRLNDSILDNIISSYNFDYKEITRAFYDEENPEKGKRLNDKALKDIADKYGFSDQISLRHEIQKPTKDSSFRENGKYFQADKIKVGDTFIELPIPSGFVKVDDSMETLLDLAKKLCPETNTLLAYYISEEDYASYLVDQNHVIEKYIFVQVFNELKNTIISGKDYRKIVNSFKKQYVDEFKAIFDEAGLKITDNFLKIDEDLKLENFKMQPFGICYESKNSVSYGILSKYDFLIDGDNSISQVVAAISTLAKVDNKPIFLFAYKIYKNNEDIKSLKAMNSNWIQEIDRKQSSVSFLADIDFEDYKETILAILTLSFIC